MKEFNEKHIKDLQEADGIVLQDVFGYTVAIGISSEYSDIAGFLSDFFEEYSLWSLSKELQYENERAMLHDLFRFPFPIPHIEAKLMNAFDGISADEYAKKLEEIQRHSVKLRKMMKDIRQ